MRDQDIIKYFYEKIVSENKLDRLPEYICEDCTLRVGDQQIPLGVEGMRKHLLEVKETYPDYTMKVIRQYTDGDHVISEFVMQGTHEGEWLGMRPSRQRLVFTGVNIDRVRAGKILEHSGAVNTFETLLEHRLIRPV